MSIDSERAREADIDETINLKASTTEQLRQNNMKSQQKVFAPFKKDALASTSMPVVRTNYKNKKKRCAYVSFSSPSVSKEKKPCAHKKMSRAHVIGAKKSVPKLIIKISKAVPFEAKVSEVTEPLRSFPVKIKISRSREGYIMKTPSNQTTSDT